MPGDSKYQIDLSELEKTARVPPEELIESVEQVEVPMPDPRGPQPDRDWFAAGG